MRSGKLRERLVIQQKTVAQNDIGYPSETWTTLATVWADVRAEKGSETLKAGRDTATEYATVFIRYRNDVTAQNRAVYRSKTWDIENVRVVQNMRRNEGLELVMRAHD